MQRHLHHLLDLLSLHPVSTAGSSLGRFRAGKQTGIGFIDLDELGEVIDAEACKGGCRFFAEAENSETTVFRIATTGLRTRDVGRGIGDVP